MLSFECALASECIFEQFSEAGPVENFASGFNVKRIIDAQAHQDHRD